MENVMKIDSIEVDLKNGFLIRFNAEAPIAVGGFVSISVDNEKKDRYFEVINIKIDSKDFPLMVTARSAGYYGKFNVRIKNVDFKALIGKSVSLVSDLETIKKIENESTYC